MVASGDKLTLREAARELDRSLEPVRRYVREGKFPVEKLGIQWFVERPSLDALKDANNRAPNTEIMVGAKSLRENIRKDVVKLDIVIMPEQSLRNHP